MNRKRKRSIILPHLLNIYFHQSCYLFLDFITDTNSIIYANKRTCSLLNLAIEDEDK